MRLLNNLVTDTTYVDYQHVIEDDETSTLFDTNQHDETSTLFDSNQLMKLVLYLIPIS